MDSVDQSPSSSPRVEGALLSGSRRLLPSPGSMLCRDCRAQRECQEQQRRGVSLSPRPCRRYGVFCEDRWRGIGTSASSTGRRPSGGATTATRSSPISMTGMSGSTAQNPLYRCLPSLCLEREIPFPSDCDRGQRCGFARKPTIAPHGVTLPLREPRLDHPQELLASPSSIR